MKDIIKITMSLTGVCVAAALILGAVFTQTEHARKDIEEKEKQHVIQGLLGFGGHGKTPEDLKIFPVYRYVVRDPKGNTVLAYLMPLKDKKHVLAEIDLEGKPGKTYQVSGDAAQLADTGARDAAIKAVLPAGSQATYAQTLYVANRGDKRLGYVVPGMIQGFKTFIQFMVALNPHLTVIGVDVTKHEEDPGLGAEIKQNYFRNQYDGKTVDMLKTLEVAKKPLPEEYRTALDPEKAKKAGMTAEKVAEIKKSHVKDDIYALTGATISSRCLTNGVKETVSKFVYRLDIITKAMKQKNVQAAF